MNQIRKYQTDKGVIITDEANNLLYSKNFSGILTDLTDKGEGWMGRFTDEVIKPGKKAMIRPNPDRHEVEGPGLNPEVEIQDIEFIPLEIYQKAVQEQERLQAEYNLKAEPIRESYQRAVNAIKGSYGRMIAEFEAKREEDLRKERKHLDKELEKFEVPSLEALLGE